MTNKNSQKSNLPKHNFVQQYFNGFVNVLTIFCARLQIWQLVDVSKLSRSILIDNSLLLDVTFVSTQHNVRFIIETVSLKIVEVVYQSRSIKNVLGVYSQSQVIFDGKSITCYSRSCPYMDTRILQILLGPYQNSTVPTPELK